MTEARRREAANSPPSGTAARSIRSPTRCLASFPAGGRRTSAVQLRPPARSSSRRPPRRRAHHLPRRDAGSPLHRRRQAVDRDLRRHVPLPDDPRDGLLLGRHRLRLPDEARNSPSEPYIFCRQADAVSTLLVNNAVLRLPPSEPALAELVATAEAVIDVDQKWGALGPFLLTPVLEKHGLYDKALDPHVCYPIEPEQFWKPFLPELPRRGRRGGRGRDASASLERGDPLERLRLRLCPPAGSYLQERFPEGRARSIAFAASATRTKSAA